MFRRQASERKRLKGLRAAQIKFIGHQYQLFVFHMRSKPVMEVVRQRIAANDIQSVINIFDPYIDRFGNGLSQAFLDVATTESGMLASKMRVHAPRVKKAKVSGQVGISFDPTDARIVQAMSRNKLDFVTDFSRKQKQSTRTALTQGISEGLGAEGLADKFKSSIGLTDDQMAQVQSYQYALETGSRDALDRQLRDRRFDSVIERAIDENDVLTADQIERMVGRYTENYIQLRAETIARTETLGIVEEARDEAFRQAIDQTDVAGEGLAAKEWATTIDGRERETHYEMNGQARELDEPFDSPSGEQLMYPGDAGASAEEVINCRCSVLHHLFGSREELEQFLEDQNG